MNSTMSLPFTMSAMRELASLTGILRLGHCRLELQCVKLSPNSPPKCGIDRLVLLDAAHPGEAAADHLRRIMVTVAGEVADRHLGVRNGRLDQTLDFARRHRHQRFVLSM